MSTKVLYVSIWTATIAVAYLLGYLGQESSPIARKMYKRNPKGIKEWLPKSGLSVVAQQRVIRGK